MNVQKPLTEKEKLIMFTLFVDDIKIVEKQEKNDIIKSFSRFINKNNVRLEELKEKADNIIDLYKEFRNCEYKKIRSLNF